MVDEPGEEPRTPMDPIVAFEELLRSVPRLVDRTVRQATLVRSLAGHLPCVGPLLAPRHSDSTTGTVTPEPTSVLDLFDTGPDDEPDDEPLLAAVPDTTPTAPVVAAVPAAPPSAPSVSSAQLAASPKAPPAAAAAPSQNGDSDPQVPLESDLGVPDYDSLAASQVVPRLAMLSVEDLRAVLAYEQSHRHRQTILNRVTQLLEA